MQLGREGLVGLPADDLSEAVLVAIRALRPPLITQETDLQGIVAGALRRAGLPFEAEYRLAPRDRIDFLVAGGVGVETKKGAPNGSRLLAQLERYARHDTISALVVVTPWCRHLDVPEEIHGKPVHMISLNRLWGVAL